MKRKILLAFVLMSFCVAGIAALQLYYSYTTYKAERRQFERDSNEALEEAVEKSFERHRKIVVGEFKAWLYDPSFITITARWNPDVKQTVFTIQETEPSAVGQSQMSMSIEDFKERLDSITPKGRGVFVNHMAKQVDSELKKRLCMVLYPEIGRQPQQAVVRHASGIENPKKRVSGRLAEKRHRAAFFL